MRGSRGTMSRTSCSPKTTAWWSVPRWRATRAAWTDSSNAGSSKPIVKVRTVPPCWRCISAVTRLESTPPQQERADRDVGLLLPGDRAADVLLDLVSASS